MRPHASLIGDPVEHSRSPMIHRFWLDALGIDGDYRADRVEPEQLQDYLDRHRQLIGWRGCNVTAPLKELAMPLVDELSHRARLIGALNAISCHEGRLHGDNFDVDGIAAAVPADRCAGKTAVIIGAGGAARAALCHLLESGADEIRLIARDPRRAAALLEMGGTERRVSVRGFDAPRIEDADLLINASPLGMRNAPMPAEILLAAKAMKPDSIVFDMVYEPLRTELLETAKSAGLRIADGLTMLVGQAEPSFQIFFGGLRLPQYDQARQSRNEAGLI